MKNTIATLVLLSIIFTPSFSLGATSTSKKQEMITKSIQSYPGNCPCPYSNMKNGRTCGKNSAWSKKGGVSPLCYISDIK